MIRRAATFVFAAFIASNLAACNLATKGQGPTVWIDQPLEGDRVPLAPVILQAHASDADGVAAIEFYASEALLGAVAVGGGRLGDAAIEWMPPAAGDYTIAARAADAQGNFGPSASARIVVEGPHDLAETPVSSLPGTGTPSPAAALVMATETPTAGAQLIAATFEPTQDANCRQGPGTAYPSTDVLMQGQELSIEGRNPEGNWFWILKPSGSGHCWVSAAVGRAKGPWQVVPIVDAPLLAITATPTPSDLTPPSITEVSIDPTTVQRSGCGGQETFTISATVTDASGVASVTYEIHGPIPSDVGEAYLIPTGGDYSQSFFEAVVGPLWNAGTWSIVLHARDMANNATQAGPWTVQVLCIQ